VIRQKQLVRLALGPLTLVAFIARAEPERLTIGLVGISSEPPLEMSCTPKVLWSNTDICGLTHLTIEQNKATLDQRLGCEYRSAIYATTHKLLDFLRNKTSVSMLARSAGSDQSLTLECQINYTRPTQTEGIQPHN
jgi:hypothetical protein